ncbi:MAG: VWA domain-containing protein [Cyclobacteriaceae bacterium]|nr:VWA domain-containing protein [Cyclobacteriaceae bacterium]
MAVTGLHFIRTGCFLLTLLVYQGLLMAQKPEQELPSKTRILFLFDASGSMLAPWENTLRINVAKKLLSDMVDSLRVNGDLELALRVYGHQYDQRLRRCDDSKLEIAFSAKNHDAIIQKIRQLKPQGNTPIAYSLQQAAGDFPKDPRYRNILIIITDGIESCDGDPCAVSRELQEKNIFLKPFVIGIGMDKKFEDAFGCMGTFYDASDINSFKRALSQAIQISLDKTTVSIELVDERGLKTETDVNVSFINNFTGKPMFDFVHYLDENGQPDSVIVETVITYDVVVNTIPPVIVKNVRFESGKHNVLEIKAPRGLVKVDMPGHSEYKNPVKVMIRHPETGKLLTHFNIPGEALLLSGRYHMEITTLPVTLLSNVSIVKDTPRNFKLETPGVINFVSNSRSIGSIYQLDKEGRQTWVTDLDSRQLRQSLAIQPGSYKVVVRSEKAKGSKYTKIKTFEVKPGASLTLQL